MTSAATTPTTAAHLRSSSLTNKSRGSFPKTPSLDNNWPSRRARARALRRSGSDFDLPDRPSEKEFQITEARSSDETVVDYRNTNFRENSAEYANAPTHVDIALKNANGAIVRRRPRRHGRYCPDLSIEQAVMAIQKLQRLRELQRKRDLSEKYYSQEIRKLISDYYFSPRINPAPLATYGTQNASLQPSSEDRARNAYNKPLEPCGTMTTITRLDCGCVQETTRPIFTTTRGRVHKKNCTESQEQVMLRLTSSKPQEHLYSTNDANKAAPRHPDKPRKRSSADSRAFAKPSGDVNDGVKNSYSQRNIEKAELRPSRNVSPVRKLSETSTASL